MIPTLKKMVSVACLLMAGVVSADEGANNSIVDNMFVSMQSCVPTTINSEANISKVQIFADLTSMLDEHAKDLKSVLVITTGEGQGAVAVTNVTLKIEQNDAGDSYLKSTVALPTGNAVLTIVSNTSGTLEVPGEDEEGNPKVIKLDLNCQAAF